MGYFQSYVKSLEQSLQQTVVTDISGKTLRTEKGYDIWCRWTSGAKRTNSSIFFIGNGASAAMASHMSADATKNGGLKAMSFNNECLLTAISNDIAYEDVFRLQLERYAQEGDLLITISSSGNSANIIKAIQSAKNKKLRVLTLSGMNENNQSRTVGDLNFFVPHNYYGIVESAHQAILHCWLDKYMDEYCLEMTAAKSISKIAKPILLPKITPSIYAS